MQSRRAHAIFRPYGPLDPWFDNTWRLEDIAPVNRGNQERLRLPAKR
jgi:hypothetical protein